MQRSRTQTLFSYLPNTVFVHESGVIVRSHSIAGEDLSGAINKPAVLQEIDRYLHAWEASDRGGLPLPSEVGLEEYRILSPGLVRWDVWPLVFECSREKCGRIRSFRRLSDIKGNARCRHCGGRLRQLRYYSAHACGQTKAMFIPKCAQNPDHGYDHVYFEDTGSFRTSVFRCRACGGSVIRRTLQSPCQCGAFAGPDGRSMMRAFTVRDTRTYYSHYVSLINLQSQAFTRLQRHASRGEVSVGHYLGAVPGIAQALREADRIGAGDASNRLSPEEWARREAQLRGMQLSEAEISAIRDNLGPATTGLEAVKGVHPQVLTLGKQLSLLERAVLFDRDEVKRLGLSEIEAEARRQGRGPVVRAVERSLSLSADLGIEEISVTWNFPIATAAFGFTRTVRERGAGRIGGFAKPDRYDGKTPVFAVASDTEAVLVTLSPRKVIEWLAAQALWEGPIPIGDRACREGILGLFAEREARPSPAEQVETLLHSMSHALLRALDDGQIGFAESSLAEWLVPETLTFALYVNNLKSYTLGALWTLLTNRAEQWLIRAYEAIWSCENDPLCHQRMPRACERCLFTSFGCPRFNDQLSRFLLQGFWRSGRPATWASADPAFLKAAAYFGDEEACTELGVAGSVPTSVKEFVAWCGGVKEFGQRYDVSAAFACCTVLDPRQEEARSAMAKVQEWLAEPTKANATDACVAGYRAYTAYLSGESPVTLVPGLVVAAFAAALTLEAESRLAAIQGVEGVGGTVEVDTLKKLSLEQVARLAAEAVVMSGGSVGDLWRKVRKQLLNELYLHGLPAQ